MNSRALALVCVAAAAGCDRATGPGGKADPCDVLMGETGPNASFTAAGAFTVSPLPLASISYIIPLGNLNPPNHVYPTDHMYLLPPTTAAGTYTVSAAAAGTVTELYKPGGGADWKLVVKIDKSFLYYYDHITPAGGLAVGSAITAGMTVGTNSGAAAAVDFGVYNYNNATLPGLLNKCLASMSGYTDSPLKYYAGALQTSLYSKITVSGGATKDGKIDYDQEGKLVGNWVQTGHTPMDGAEYALAFVYNVNTHAMRVSYGASSGGGSYAVQSSGTEQSFVTDWASVSESSGQVNYRLYPTGGGDNGSPGAEYGVLAVQVVSSSRIKVEFFPGNMTGTAAFTSAVKTFDR